MAYNLIECNRDQAYLLPPSLREWLPEKDLAWFVVDAVGEMELGVFYSGYRDDGTGQAAYDPGMMVALMLYAYCVGERSSRRIERMCERDIGFRVIAANARPDHSTVSRFRRKHHEALSELFTKILALCAKAGLVKVGMVALDGTKEKANAALAANRARESIQAEVDRMLAEAEAVDTAEDKLYGPDKRGDELPEELQDRRSRLARLKAAKAALEAEQAAEEAAHAERMAKREAEEEASGKKKRGRKPKEPEGGESAKANITDPESRIMKTRTGYVQGYNGQAAVTEEQIIIAAEVTQEANDVRQLHPMLASATKELKAAGVEEKIGAVAADAGYWSEQNMTEADAEGPELFIATTKDWKQRKALRERGSPRGRMPKEMTARDRMERKLLTKRGREIYRKRGMTVEPVFGQEKSVRGCDHFLVRGTPMVRMEWRLICGTHNLLKLWRSGKAKFKEWCRETMSASSAQGIPPIPCGCG
jgi:transposase